MTAKSVVARLDSLDEPAAYDRGHPQPMTGMWLLIVFRDLVVRIVAPTQSRSAKLDAHDAADEIQAASGEVSARALAVSGACE